MKQKVEGESLVRDSRTNALLSTDRRAVDEYRRRKAAAEAQQDAINSLKAEVEGLKALIHSLLKNGIERCPPDQT